DSEGVGAVAANDVWASRYSRGGDYHTLTMHWDGSAWSIGSSPSNNKNTYLRGVAAIASNDVWAVGSSEYGGVNNESHAVIEHWDGSAWSIIPSPNQDGYLYQLYGVAAVSSNDVWTV